MFEKIPRNVNVQEVYGGFSRRFWRMLKKFPGNVIKNLTYLRYI